MKTTTTLTFLADWLSNRRDFIKTQKAQLTAHSFFVLTIVLVLLALAGPAQASQILYWAEQTGEAIRRSDTDGTNKETIASTNSRHPLGIDVQNGRVYWGEQFGDGLRYANLDGSSPGLLTNTGPIFGVAAGADYIFYADRHDGVIRIDLDGNNPLTIGIGEYGVDLDEVNRKVYVADRVNIKRFDYDGGNVETIFSNPGSDLIGIAVDPLNEMIYWIEDRTKKVRRATYQGLAVEDLFTTTSSPEDIAIDFNTGEIYVATLGSIVAANLDGSNLRTVTGASRSHGVALNIMRPVPEPSSIALALASAFSLVTVAWRRRRRSVT